MNTFLILLLYIGSPGSIGEPLSGSKGNRAPVSCEVCDVKDPNCVKGGARTVCDVAQQYCLTEVTDTLGGDRSVGRKCADLTECQQKFAVTEERLFCYEVDMGNLRADVTCSFCCQGDLCNQGPDLIPPAQFLYNGELNVTRLSTPVVSTSKPAVMTSSTTDSATSGLSTVTVDMCEVCDVKDQDCFHGGTPTSCDVDHAFCMTTVHDNFPNNMTVSRSCVNESVCYQKWYMETSWRHYCYDIDQGELYFPVDCNFCCVGDLCNAGPTLVPSPETLYQPMVVPTVSGRPPTSAVSSEGSSPTRKGLTGPTQPYTLESTTGGLTGPTLPNPQGSSTDGLTGPTPPNPQGSSTDGLAGPTLPNTQGSSTDGLTGPTSPNPQGSSTDGLTGPTPPNPQGSSTDGLTGPTPPNPQGSSTDGLTGPTLPNPQGSSTDGSTGPTLPNPQGSSTDGSTGPTPPNPQGSSTDGLTGPTLPNPQGSSTDGSTGPTLPNPQGSSTDGSTGPTLPNSQGSSTDGSTGPTLPNPQGSSTGGSTGPTPPNPQGSSTDSLTGPTPPNPQGSSTVGLTGPTPSKPQGSSTDSLSGPTPPNPQGSSTSSAGPGSSPVGSVATYVTQPPTVSTTEKHTICEVCDESDPECFTSGTPTLCNLEESYCMTTVHDNYPSNMTVSRGCVNESVCYQKWYMETSWRHYCYDIDQGELYFPVDCNFCCVGDLCNSGTLVPDPDTLYRPPSMATEGSTVDVATPSSSYNTTTAPSSTDTSMTTPSTTSVSTTEKHRPPSLTTEGSTVDVATPSSSYNTATEPSSTDTSMTTPSTTSVSTTEKHTICEVCDESDPECFTSGTPTLCDLEESYCMTTVHDNYPSNMTVSRGCVNESVCYQKWYMETSWRHYCYDIDQGELYFPVDCNFCCVGDLCNSGTLVPDPDTLYRPPEPTNTTDLSPTSETQNTPTPTVPTTPHLAVCDVCSRDDLGCVHGGRPTLCDPDRPYCQTTVYEDNRFNQYAERSCADLNMCETDWINHTSGRPYCLEVDKGPLFYPNYCSFCCVGDQCNNGSLVPSIETLYYPMVIPSTSIPLSTTHPDITEATSGVIKTTSDVTQTTSEVIKTSSDVTQATSDVTQTSTESTTIHRPICDTCSPDDPQCMTGGQPTMCDLDTQFCMTSVIEDMSSKQTARRMCVNETACQVDWLRETSSKYYCFQVDQGPLYFANTCSFCCRGDLCNSGTLVPDPQTLYVLPPATESTTTDFFPTTS
ncbi:flocculation protein FLO11-like isoform X1 [Haliotis rufescens]|uniref:flocculation protein FLO11-like isoform X1 n=1 Tax=Haliotis rufescens TaxID=6454 RepID=UPI00201FA6B1|nr:flocculation protein FLO11-like isoform X1 [Haliotis rufescens]